MEFSERKAYSESKEFISFKMKEDEENSKRMSDGTSNPSLITQPESNFGPCIFIFPGKSHLIPPSVEISSTIVKLI